MTSLVSFGPVFIVIGLTSCGAPSAMNKDCAPKTGAHLFVFGDSITAGSYPSMVACQTGRELVNVSIGGTSIEFANQYSMIMIHQRNWAAGDAVLFAPGVNDGILYAQAPAHVALFTQYVSDIVAMAALHEAVFYIGTPIRSCDEARFGSNSNSEVYAEITRAAVDARRASNVRLIDFRAAFTPTVENTQDCLHPNETGNGEMAIIFMKEAA